MHGESWTFLVRRKWKIYTTIDNRGFHSYHPIAGSWHLADYSMNYPIWQYPGFCWVFGVSDVNKIEFEKNEDRIYI